jgi:hypothetical protein
MRGERFLVTTMSAIPRTTSKKLVQLNADRRLK